MRDEEYRVAVPGATSTRQGDGTEVQGKSTGQGYRARIQGRYKAAVQGRSTGEGYKAGI